MSTSITNTIRDLKIALTETGFPTNPAVEDALTIIEAHVAGLCPDCHGGGKVRTCYQDHYGPPEKCPTCRGTGRCDLTPPCPNCNGHGKVRVWYAQDELGQPEKCPKYKGTGREVKKTPMQWQYCTCVEIRNIGPVAEPNCLNCGGSGLEKE